MHDLQMHTAFIWTACTISAPEMASDDIAFDCEASDIPSDRFYDFGSMAGGGPDPTWGTGGSLLWQTYQVAPIFRWEDWEMTRA